MRPDHYRFAAGILQLVRPELSAASSQCVSECTRASFKLISSQLFYNDWGSDSSDLLPHNYSSQIHLRTNCIPSSVVWQPPDTRIPVSPHFFRRELFQWRRRRSCTDHSRAVGGRRCLLPLGQREQRRQQQREPHPSTDQFIRTVTFRVPVALSFR